MAKRKTRRARRNTGRLPWVKVMVRGLVGPGFMDSGWATGPFFVYAPEKTDQAAVLNAVRKAIYYTEIEKWSPVSFERVASVPDRMFPHTTVGLDGEYIPRTGAKKNPRSLSMTSDGFQRTPTLSQASGSTQSPQDRTIFDAGVSQVTGGRPTFSQLEEGNLFTQGSSQGGNLEPSWEPSLLPQEQDWERPTPEFEQIEQSQTPTDTTSWRQGYTRGGSYMRSSSASQPGSPTPDAKMMRQLIDPQLWRLADGGDRQAMYELERRGPSHYRPARPNPPNPYLMKLEDAIKGKGKGGKKARKHKRSHKKLARRNPSQEELVQEYLRLYAEYQELASDSTWALRTLDGYRDSPSTWQRGQVPAQQAVYRQASAAAKAAMDAYVAVGKRLTKATKDKYLRERVRVRARRNTTASPAARGFTFMHADDNNQWAEWALSRQGIQHRGTGYGPGSWPVAARQNPGKVAKKIKTFSKGQALWHVSPPVAEVSGGKHSYMISSKGGVGWSETYFFPADASGNITSMVELWLSSQDPDEPETLLKEAGYTIEGVAPEYMTRSKPKPRPGKKGDWYILAWGPKSASGETNVFRVQKSKVSGADEALRRVANDPANSYYQAFTVHADPYSAPVAVPVCRPGVRYNPRLSAFVADGRGAALAPPPTDMSSARPGYGGFLKAGTTSWPAWKASTGWNHAKVAIQFMTRGFGVRGDYPKYIRRLAKFLPPSNPRFSEIWDTYVRNRSKIAAMAGRPMPDLDELKGRG
jgi:hypothetical protein